MAFVGVLAWFYDPDVVAVRVFSLFQAPRLKVHIVIGEALKFRVIFALRDMESYRQVGERVLAYSFIVILHIDEQRLLIRQVIIIFQLVVYFCVDFRRRLSHKHSRRVLERLLFAFKRS